MEILRLLDQLFREHRPETLMAFFWGSDFAAVVLSGWGGAARPVRLADPPRELGGPPGPGDDRPGRGVGRRPWCRAGHLRTTLDSILEEALRRSEQHSRLLAGLAVQAEETPGKTVALLRPEFDHLRRELRQAEARLSAKMILPAGEVEAGEAADETAPETHP